jgi:hypothetical protein
LPDINHLWGNDIVASPTGDLGTVDGPNLTIERIIRRLMTRGEEPASVNQPYRPAEYIWENSYGAGLPNRIGDAFDLPLLTSVITSQILKEPAVARVPPPQVTFVPSILGSLTVNIAYNDRVTGAQQQLSFDVNQ